MAEVRLKASKRERAGKGVARKVRAGGRVPAVLYGQGMDPVSIEVDRREFIVALNTDAGMNVLLDLEIDGQTTLALTKELQQDPVRGTLLHADFVKLDRTQEIEVTVPVQIVGEAAGVKEGGVLDQPLHELQVRCLPSDVPESIEADVTALTIGDSLRVSDLSAGRNFTILNEPEETVVNISAPISVEELEAMEAAASAGAPEEVPEVAAEASQEADAEAPTEETGASE